MAWTITRLVGCDHILQIRNLAQVDIANALGPNGVLTGPGRSGKQRIAFILTNDDLSLTDPATEGDDSQVQFAVDSGIAFQDPPNALSAGDVNYSVDTPLDPATFIPIMHWTPLAPGIVTAAGSFIAAEAGGYLIYNQVSGALVAARVPTPLAKAATKALIPTSDPNPNGQLIFAFGVSNDVFAVTPAIGALSGSFLIEIDFSHSVAS